MPPKIMFIVMGLINIVGVFGFLIGYFFNISLLLIICGCILVLDDCICQCKS